MQMSETIPLGRGGDIDLTYSLHLFNILVYFLVVGGTIGSKCWVLFNSCSRASASSRLIGAIGILRLIAGKMELAIS